MSSLERRRRGHGERTLTSHPTTRRVWFAVSWLWDLQHRPPTYREIAEQAEVALGSVGYHLAKLHIAGKVFWSSGQARSVVIREHGPEFLALDAERRRRRGALSEREADLWPHVHREVE